MTASTSAVLVVSAPTLLRQGLLALFRERWPQVRLSFTADATEVAALAAHGAFGLILLDGTAPGLDLLALLDELQRIRPTQRLLVLADSHNSAMPDARACPVTQRLLSSHVPPDVLAQALAPWMEAEPGVAPARPSHACSVGSHFSRRELQVLRLVVADHCNQEIANQLFINVRTVESHRRNLLQKAGTRTLVGLAARAVREGWVA